MKRQIILCLSSAVLLALFTMLTLIMPFFSILYLPFVFALFASLAGSGNKFCALLFVCLTFAVFCMLKTGIYFAICFLLIPFLAGNVFDISVKKGANQKQVLGIFAVGTGLSLCVMLFSASGFSADALNTYFEEMSDVLLGNLDMFSTEGIISEDMIPSVINQFNLVLAEIKNLLPGILVVISIAMGYIALVLTYFLNKLYKNETVFVPQFSTFKCSTVTCTVMVIAAIATIFLKEGPLSVAFDNIFYILSFMLSACAISLTDYWMKSKRWHVVPRFLIIFFMFTYTQGSLLSMVFCVIAFFDSRINFRKLEN